MAAELTSEEIVTKLLTSNEILKPKDKNFYMSKPKSGTLGDFLLEFPLKRKIPDVKPIEELRYRFITK